MKTVSGELQQVGQQIQPKGFEPSYKLQDAVMAFKACVHKECPQAQVHIGQTDRDLVITIKGFSPNPFHQLQYAVWDEGDEIAGSIIEGSKFQ